MSLNHTSRRLTTFIQQFRPTRPRRAVTVSSLTNPIHFLPAIIACLARGDARKTSVGTVTNACCGAGNCNCTIIPISTKAVVLENNHIVHFLNSFGVRQQANSKMWAARQGKRCKKMRERPFETENDLHFSKNRTHHAFPKKKPCVTMESQRLIAVFSSTALKSAMSKPVQTLSHQSRAVSKVMLSPRSKRRRPSLSVG